MIDVDVLRAGNQTVGFTCSGHAEYDAYGKDIVCSAVSALTQTCILGLTNVAKIDAGVSVSEKDGITCILDRDATKEQIAQAQLLFDTMVLGLGSIASAYPNTLNIQHREV